MDTALRIQVRVAARQANQELQRLGVSVKQVARAAAAAHAAANKASHNLAKNQVRLDQAKQLAALKVQQAQQMANLKVQQQMLKVQQQQGAAGASAKQKAQLAAVRAQHAQILAQIKQQEAAQVAQVKVQQQQVRLGTQQIRQDQARVALQRQQLAYMAQMWKMQTGGANPIVPPASRFAGLHTSMDALVKRGKDLQWVGRQINFNFTIPLLYAAGMATKWALDTERAFTRVRKVYDGPPAELEQIQQGVRLLSDHFGIAQEEVMGLAAQWAAAGASGAALLESVRSSLELSILGDYEDLEATFTDLVAIQAAFRMSTQELALAVAQLNTVDNNSTVIGIDQLTVGLARAGAVADIAGVSFAELTSLLTVLTPAFGTGATAGNGLKSMLQRLMSPTEEIKKNLGELGDGFLDAFFAVDGVDRLKMIAAEFDRLNDSQKGWLLGEVAGTYQANRFGAIMRDLNADAGVYERTLAQLQAQETLTAEARERAQKALNDQNFATAAKEIQTLLESDPKKLEVAFTQLKNSMIQAVMPLIPFFVKLAEGAAAVAGWFANLSPGVQGLIVGFLGLTIATGILAQGIGSIQILFGTFVRGALWMVGALQGLMGTQVAAAGVTQATNASNTRSTVTAAGIQVGAWLRVAAAAIASAAASAAAWIAANWPIALAILGIVAVIGGAVLAFHFFGEQIASFAKQWGLVILAGMTGPFGLAVALAVKFRERIGQTMSDIAEWIGRAFNALPSAIAAAMNAVIRIIAGAITVIRNLLSYLNPFARHSPSLVDNVKAGVAVIAAEYGKLTNMGVAFRRATSDLKAFADATAALRASSQAKDRSTQRDQIVKGSPNAGPIADRLYADLDRLGGVLNDIGGRVATQEATVNGAKDAYDAAAAAVDRFDKSLGSLRDRVSSLNDQLSDAKSELQEYAKSPLTGMRAMEDAIFANEYAQKQLRLEIMRMEGAGQSYDDLLSQISEIEGALEGLRARMTGLREGGAGSDILKVYQEQVDALEEQKDQLTGSAKNGKDLAKQLEKLQRTGEILDLEKALKFDKLIYQIEKLADESKELTFAEIVKGVKDQKKAVADLTKEYDQAKLALDTQEAVLKTLTERRDALKDTYDAEELKLKSIQDEYSKTEDKIRELEDALKDAAAAWENLNRASQAGGGGGGAGGGAGAGGGMPGGGDFGDIDQMIADMESEMGLDELLADWEKMFEDLDPFAGIKSFFQKIADGASWGWNYIVKPALFRLIFGLPGLILSYVSLGDLMDIGGKIVGALKDGALWVWNSVFKTFWNDALPAIGRWIGDRFENLTSIGGKIIAALRNGIDWVWNSDIASFFRDVVATAAGWIGSRFTDLYNRGRDLLGEEGLWGGVQSMGWSVIQWFGDLPGGLLRAIGNNAGRLLDAGVLLILQLGLGIARGVEQIPIVGDILDAVWGGLGVNADDIQRRIDEITGNVTPPPSDQLVKALQVWFEHGALNPEWSQDEIDAAIEEILSTPAPPDPAGLRRVISDWAGEGFASGMDLGARKELPGMVGTLRAHMHAIAAGTEKKSGDTFVGVGKSAMLSVQTGMSSAEKDVKRYAGGLSSNISGWAGRMDRTLDPAGYAAMSGLLGGMRLGALAVTVYAARIPTVIAAAVPSTSDTLSYRGATLMNGMKTGMAVGLLGVTAYARLIPGAINTGMGSTYTTLNYRGAALMAGLRNGMSVGYLAGVYPFARGLGGAVGSAVGNLSGALFQAGVSVMRGFELGLRAQWISVMLFLRAASRAIPSLKGPPAYDRKVLVGAGELVMQGFQTGLKSGWADTTALLGTMTSGINGALRQPTFETAQPAIQGSGETHLHFHGNLTFPNISSGDDAERFIGNLETLAGVS